MPNNNDRTVVIRSQGPCRIKHAPSATSPTRCWKTPSPSSRRTAKQDSYPVSEGHLLIIPKRHATDWFDLTSAERTAINDLLMEAKAWLHSKHQPDGYNIGMNCGAAAGQTVFHMHCHLIPRYRGDTDNPAGGVRGVIPGKQHYG